MWMQIKRAEIAIVDKNLKFISCAALKQKTALCRDRERNFGKIVKLFLVTMRNYFSSPPIKKRKRKFREIPPCSSN
jgi:hypothetical protein